MLLCHGSICETVALDVLRNKAVATQLVHEPACQAGHPLLSRVRVCLIIPFHILHHH